MTQADADFSACKEALKRASGMRMVEDVRPAGMSCLSSHDDLCTSGQAFNVCQQALQDDPCMIDVETICAASQEVRITTRTCSPGKKH